MLIEENEELAGKGITFEKVSNDPDESAERLSHIDRFGIDRDGCIDVEIQHDAISRTIRATNSGVAFVILRVNPLGSVISI